MLRVHGLNATLLSRSLLLHMAIPLCKQLSLHSLIRTPPGIRQSYHTVIYTPLISLGNKLSTTQEVYWCFRVRDINAVIILPRNALAIAHYRPSLYRACTPYTC